MDEEKAAYHEAGHAVIACLSGGEIIEATILRDWVNCPEQAGRVSVAWRSSIKSDAQNRQAQIHVVLAGPIAEMIYDGERRHPAKVPEWAVDWQTACVLVQPMARTDAARERLLVQICALMYQQMQSDRVWQTISEVADLLLAHETITGDEVREVVERWLTGTR